MNKNPRPINIEHSGYERNASGAGYSNWQKSAQRMGDRALANFLEKLDPGDVSPRLNAHTAIARRLESLGLPIQSYISLPADEFLCDPQRHLERISNGDYYFASIEPGIHIANTKDARAVVSFVNDYVACNPDKHSKSIYISHNGMPTMSGHIIIDNDVAPNTISAEFTIGNFNLFHRGFRTPEITVSRRGRRFSWNFREELASGDWRNEKERFVCNDTAALSRPEMARRIYDAISRIPHDEDKYLPGYYEVLLENVDGYRTRPAFIEAITPLPGHV